MNEPEPTLHSLVGAGQRVVTDRWIAVVRVHENGARTPVVALMEAPPGSTLPFVPFPLISPAEDTDAVAGLYEHAEHARAAGATLEIRELHLGPVLETFNP